MPIPRDARPALLPGTLLLRGGKIARLILPDRPGMGVDYIPFRRTPAGWSTTEIGVFRYRVEKAEIRTGLGFCTEATLWVWADQEVPLGADMELGDAAGLPPLARVCSEEVLKTVQAALRAQPTTLPAARQRLINTLEAAISYLKAQAPTETA